MTDRLDDGYYKAHGSRDRSSRTLPARCRDSWVKHFSSLQCSAEHVYKIYKLIVGRTQNARLAFLRANHWAIVMIDIYK